jgi:hypothetical protein
VFAGQVRCLLEYVREEEEAGEAIKVSGERRKLSFAGSLCAAVGPFPFSFDCEIFAVPGSIELSDRKCPPTEEVRMAESDLAAVCCCATSEEKTPRTDEPRARSMRPPT